jgi:hypothetical protein
MVLGGIGLRSKKSEVSGEICMVALELRINGPARAQRVVQVFVLMEEAMKASADTSLPLSCQSTEAEWSSVNKASYSKRSIVDID